MTQNAITQNGIIRPTLAVSLAMFRDDGHVLIATRTKPPAAHVWSLPGGRVEPGETLAAAALREMEEEVGAKAQIIGFNRHVEAIGRGGDGAPSHHFVVASFVGRWLAGEPQPGPEAGEVRWVQPDGLAGLPVTHELPHVLMAAQRIWEAA
ncbi:MAG: NUDIX hydrolase, partial [Bosea sp. (in: a-proteobacteria)]